MAILPANFEYTRWSDSLERNIMNQSLSNGQVLSVKELGNTMWKGLKNTVKYIGTRLVETSEVIYEARVLEARLRSTYYYRY